MELQELDVERVTVNGTPLGHRVYARLISSSILLPGLLVEIVTESDVESRPKRSDNPPAQSESSLDDHPEALDYPAGAVVVTVQVTIALLAPSVANLLLPADDVQDEREISPALQPSEAAPGHRLRCAAFRYGSKYAPQAKQRVDLSGLHLRPRPTGVEGVRRGRRVLQIRRPIVYLCA